MLGWHPTHAIAPEAALTLQPEAAAHDPEARYFDPEYYCRTYPDVVTADVDPLHHYRHWGALEGRNPNAFFAADWYLLQNPDVLEAGINPLHHYAAFGASEGRHPHPRFDVSFYVNQVPEAAADPLLYHLRTGRTLGLPTERRFDITGGTPHPAPSGIRVDVVIPVYRGLDATRRCLRSLLRDPKPGLRSPLHRIIVIDDASPEPALSRYLDRLAARRFIHLLRNPANLGFVASVNRGIAEAGARDVVLLNADTEVPADWLGRLMGHAYSHSRVATVSPFSNNATLCSYPAVEGGPLPFGETLARIDAACLAANAGRSVTVPTTVGFCMYLRRDALDELGNFDADTFGRGYGEENDYCMRANAAGWRHLLACDIFVYHEGEVSFGGNAPERVASVAPLEARWPDYRRRVGIHVRLDEARPFRIAATLQLFATNGLPTILTVQHAYDGGVGQYVRTLADQCQGVANLLVLRATMDGQGVRLGAPAVRRHPELLIPLQFPKAEDDKDDAEAARPGHKQVAEAGLLADVLTLLAPLRIARVHVQHWVNLRLDLRALIQALDVPFDLTIHDWFAICPRINLLPVADGPSCGEPAPAVCDRCIQARDDTAAHDIIGWRAEQAWLPRLADRVLCATQDSIDRLARHGLARRAVLAPLEAMPEAIPSRPLMRPEPAPLGAAAQSRPVRVAVLGVLADHKGAPMVTALAELATPEQFAITLIGKSERATPPEARPCLSETGAYEPAELPDLIARVDPDVIWFPASWPETWSYTLTAAILSGRPIVASDIGAFRQRLAGHPRARLVSPQAFPETWMEALAAMARPEAGAPASPSRRAPRPPEARPPEARPPEARPAEARRPNFYEGAYRAPLAASALLLARSRGLTDLRAPGKRAVVLVPERLDIGVLSPCAYIRLLLPLSHPGAGREIEVTLATAEQALSLQADLIVTHRYAVPDQAAAAALLAHAARTRVPLVFDLDDNLVELPPEHPESERLGPRAETVIALLAGADRINVSTPLLTERLLPFVRGGIDRIRVIPNGLDERLWSEPVEPWAGAGSASAAGLAEALAEAGVTPGPVRILYMGTATHGADLGLVLPALARLHESFGDRIAIEIVGITGPGILPPFIRRVEVPARAGLSYPAFVAWLTDRQRRQPWSIGIAPLADTPFNRCKSAIKMLDYAALGLATVVSDMPAYRDVSYGDFAQPLEVEGAIAGGYLAQTSAQWFHGLARLVRRPALRLAMARLGHAAWRRSGTLSAQAEMRSEALESSLTPRRNTTRREIRGGFGAEGAARLAERLLTANR
ncbi:glycosyltransferase [Acidisoma sp.]|uniref:glycosyltransferase n=1 Tax=Acidisoma sp. TaxID=1872115 RepID=UPI003AFF756E